MTQKEVIKKVEELLAKALPEKNLTLWDVEMVKEGKNLYLRVYIDKEEGVGISDCEFTSRYLSQALDELDPIEAPYMLEVSSPGINRVLKRDSDFVRYIGHLADIKLFKPHETTNQKESQGTIQAFANETLTITTQDGKTLHFNKKEIAKARLSVSF